MNIRKRLGFFRMLGVLGEVRTLEAALQPGETVEAVGIGKRNGEGGLLAATGTRLLWVHRDGMVIVTTELPYQDIKTFMCSTALINARLEFGVTSGLLVVENLDLRQARELKYAIEKGRAV